MCVCLRLCGMYILYLYIHVLVNKKNFCFTVNCSLDFDSSSNSGYAHVDGVPDLLLE